MIDREVPECFSDLSLIDNPEFMTLKLRPFYQYLDPRALRVCP